MDTDDTVREHYSGDDLEARVLGALRGTGVDVDHLRVDDLSGIDQLHAGFVPSTEYLLDALDLTSATQLLDVGAGIGGPARVAADRYGCHVTGIDLSPDFVRPRAQAHRPRRSHRARHVRRRVRHRDALRRRRRSAGR